MPQEQWGKPEKGPHMGRLRVLDNAGQEQDPEHPGESTEQGCPGSWYRCEFVYSVMPYERMLTEAGFSENLRLTRSEDPLILEAVHYLEQQRIRSSNYDLEKQAELMRSKK